MKTLDFDTVNSFVNENIVAFHQRRISYLEDLQLSKLLKKNPYLFKAKNLNIAGELIDDLLTAFLSSQEETMFGAFLEDLAIFVAGQTCDGSKSSAQGIDLEFVNRGIHYLVSIKSGPNWGNSSQQARLEADFKNAMTRMKQSQHGINVEPILGICYGKTRTGTYRGVAMKVVGQNFWFLISEDENLFIEIVEPIGYRARQHNEQFYTERARVINKLTAQFMDEFCINGEIDWARVVTYNSGNLDIANWYE